MRLALALMAAGLTTGAARAECRTVPLPETPDALRAAFAQRMQRVGTGDWLFATETPRGTMYFSQATPVRFFAKDAGGLTEEVGLLLPPEAGDVDTVRMETAATFLAAHITGTSESDLSARVARAIADTRKDGQTHILREGETVLVFSSPTPRAVVLISGRRRCD